jgi:hypothetical protein
MESFTVMTVLVSDILLRGKFDEMEDEEEEMGTKGISISPKLRKQMATLYVIL